VGEAWVRVTVTAGDELVVNSEVTSSCLGR